MEPPTILTVDDDPQVLRAVERDLRDRYTSDYRILAASSGEEALEVLGQVKLRNDEVALIVSDQRMPGMGGVDLLEQAAELYPRAKRALLTAYADTDVAIRAINTTRLDHYITKPWDPPEERLYPILDDLLRDWLADFRPPFQGIRIIDGRWSQAAHRVKRFLARNRVPYEFVDVEDDEGRELVALADANPEDLPLVVLPDGQRLLAPDPATIAEHIGHRTHARSPFYDLVIVGGGPAGLAAAVYGASEGLETLVIEREALGGQAGQSSLIKNYLGFPKGISGGLLAERARAQAGSFGAELLLAREAVGLDHDDPYHVVRLADGGEVNCHALLIATGVSYRELPVEGAEAVLGAGLYYGASITEAETHRGQEVIVVGGGNSAGQAALYLAGFAAQVTVLIRGASLTGSMSQYLVDELEAAENIEIRTDGQIAALHEEDDHLAGVTIESTADGEAEEVEIGAVFVFIGQAPRTGWVSEVVERDERGFILTGPDCSADGAWRLERPRLPLEASLPGVFVAGDVRHGSMKRVASATGEGAMAVRFVHEYLADR